MKNKLLLEEALFEDDVTMEVPEIENEEPTTHSQAEETPEGEAEETSTDFGGEETSTEEQPIEHETITYKVSFTLGKHTNWSRVDADSEEDAKQQVMDYVTKKWPDREFEITDVEKYEEIEESLTEQLNEDLSSKYSDIFYRYVEHLTNEDNYDDLIYLVNQLIRYCKDEDLKDLWYDRMEKIANENGFNSDNAEESLKDEPLNESVVDGEPIEPGPAVGMAAVISDLIKDEYEAVDGYNSAIATAEEEGFAEAARVLVEIQAEENIHIGQLQEVMKLFDPNADKVEDGRQEGEEQLSTDTINMSEDWHNMNDREYARMEEITNKFHKMSAKQFMDLYISGTIKATFVQDSDDIPGYNETIDIDSTDLSQGAGNVVAYVMLSPVDGKLYGYVSY